MKRFNMLTGNPRMFPMRVAQIYLWSTYGIFLLSDFSREINNLHVVTLFVSCAYLLFYLGYLAGIRTVPLRIYTSTPSPVNWRLIRAVLYIGSAYYFIWGVNQIIDFGGRDLSTVISSILQPGASYQAKFDVYEYRISENIVNPITQVLILLSLIYAIYLPVLVFYWRNVDAKLKAISLISVAVYVASFLAIGTQKGVGDVLLMVGAGLAILYGSAVRRGFHLSNRSLKMGSVVLIAIVVAYMVANQAARAEAFGISDSFMFGDVSETWIAYLFGDSTAYGVYAVLGYPSHGYAGLSHNLNQEFVFSNGAGISQALDSYRLQYLGGENYFNLTYPARTEAATGWPAGMYWATAFPWIASDLTFIGAALIMFPIGAIFARTWIACVVRSDIVSFAILGQIFIFVAFVPANNQVLMGRQGLWVVISISAVLFVRMVLRSSR